MATKEQRAKRAQRKHNKYLVEKKIQYVRKMVTPHVVFNSFSTAQDSLKVIIETPYVVLLENSPEVELPFMFHDKVGVKPRDFTLFNKVIDDYFYLLDTAVPTQLIRFIVRLRAAAVLVGDTGERLFQYAVAESLIPESSLPELSQPLNYLAQELHSSLLQIPHYLTTSYSTNDTLLDLLLSIKCKLLEYIDKQNMTFSSAEALNTKVYSIYYDADAII